MFVIQIFHIDEEQFLEKHILFRYLMNSFAHKQEHFQYLKINSTIILCKFIALFFCCLLL